MGKKTVEPADAPRFSFFSSGILAVRLTWDDLEGPQSEGTAVSGNPL